MDESQESYERIDANELEYVKCMIQSGEIRVKLDWLRAKILIVKYFKAAARKECHMQESLSSQFTEESKDKEEDKKGIIDPEIILQDIYSMINKISETNEKKSRVLTKSISKSSSTSSLLTQDDEFQ